MQRFQRGCQTDGNLQIKQDNGPCFQKIYPFQKDKDNGQILDLKFKYGSILAL
jgi:hypothetical protein